MNSKFLANIEFDNIGKIDLNAAFEQVNDSNFKNLLKALKDVLSSDDYMFMGDDKMEDVINHLKKIDVLSCLRFCAIVTRRGKVFHKMGKGNGPASNLIAKLNKKFNLFNPNVPKKSGFRPESFCIAMGPIMMCAKSFYKKEIMGEYNIAESSPLYLPLEYRWTGSISAMSQDNSITYAKGYDAYLDWYIAIRKNENSKKTAEQVAKAKERTKAGYYKSAHKLSITCRNVWASSVYTAPEPWDVDSRPIQPSEWVTWTGFPAGTLEMNIKSAAEHTGQKSDSDDKGKDKEGRNPEVPETSTTTGAGGK